MNKSILKITTVLLFMIVCFLAFLPNYNELPEVISISSVLNHMVAFVVLSGLLHVSFEWKIWQKVLFLSLYGVFIEVTQYFLETRYFELFDIVVNSVGIALFYVSCFMAQKTREKLILWRKI